MSLQLFIIYVDKPMLRSYEFSDFLVTDCALYVNGKQNMFLYHVFAYISLLYFFFNIGMIF